MPLGIVSDSDFLEELPLVNNEVLDESITELEVIIESGIVDPTPLGRPEGKQNTPDFIRNIIGEESIKGATNKELSALFNVGSQIPSVYKTGAHSQATYNNRNTDTAKHVKSVRERIVKKASRRLVSALDQITDDKLVDASLVTLSAVAKNMSGIIKDMSPEEKAEDNKAQIVIFAPRPAEISSYEMLQLNE